MNIIGLDCLVFGVDDVQACHTFLTDYGLTPVDVDESGGHYAALDGTSFEIRQREDKRLPPALSTGSTLRKTVYGVASAKDLEIIAEDLGRDRDITRLHDGSLECQDDMGFVLGFQVTVRKPIEARRESTNTPGATEQRAINDLGVRLDEQVQPLTLSHVVYYVPDVPKAEAFYIERLGFRCTDRLLGAGPFLQPPAQDDHHTLFLIQTPPFMQGIDHCTFHFAGPTDTIRRGYELVEKGYESFWGPGRHIMGSNWFWYFNSPLGCKVELDADMDKHDAQWQPREAPGNKDNSQAFLLTFQEKWMPGGK